MRSASALPALLLLGATAQPAHASGVKPDVQATTLLQIKQDARDGTAYTVIPVYTVFNLQARKLKLHRRVDTDVVVSSWGKMDGAAPVNGRLLNGDISLAYVDGKIDAGSARVGRQLVFEGVARGAHMDGVYISARPMGRLGASVFAGVPVVPLLQEHLGQAMVGGRVSWMHSFETQVGASVLHVLDKGRHAHQHVGVDGRVVVIPTVTLAGALRWSTLQGSQTAMALWPKAAEWRALEVVDGVRDRMVPAKEGAGRFIPHLAEADVSLGWQPVSFLHLTGVYRRTSPPLFIPRSSIFSVFSAEQRDQLGGTFAATLIKRITVDADAAALLMPAGWGFQGGMRGMAEFNTYHLTTVGVQSRVLRVPTNGYMMGRVFGRQKIHPIFQTAVDADLYVLEKPVHGQRFTAMVAWTNGLMFLPGWDVSLQVAAGSSPLATARVEGLLRLAYNAGVPFP
jgi:hypothetical protein